jgi:hypothetical protein
MQIARAFDKSRPKPGVKLYLYKLKMTTVETRSASSVSRLWIPETAPYGVGLLTRKPLPDVSIQCFDSNQYISSLKKIFSVDIIPAVSF